MFAGMETSSHSMTSALYFLHKNPDKLAILLKELEDAGLKRFEKHNDLYTLEKMQELNYLNYVVKEALRLDGPAFDSLNHCTYEDVRICGVPIPKGTILRLDMQVTHLDPKEWQKPNEFIPERFDPESEYFLRPNSGGKSRSPYSFIPFTYGSRGCPGRSFAMLEIRVVLAYLLTHVDFSIEKEYFDRPGIGFGVGTNLEMDFTVIRNIDLE